MPRELKINLKLNDANSLDVGLIDHLLLFSSGTGQSERSNEIKRLLRIALLGETFPMHTERKIRPYFADELTPRTRGQSDDPYVYTVPAAARQVARIDAEAPDRAGASDSKPAIAFATPSPIPVPVPATGQKQGNSAEENDIPMGLAFLQHMPASTMRDLSP